MGGRGGFAPGRCTHACLDATSDRPFGAKSSAGDHAAAGARKVSAAAEASSAAGKLRIAP